MAFDVGSFAGQAASGLIGGAFGLIGQKRQFEYNKQLAALQNKFNIDMWKMQADYNSPQAQMQRFQDAGLNPNLIYGQGSSGNMSSAPEQVTPPAPSFDKAAAEFAKAFNIEGIRTMIANRKKAQAEARKSELEQFNMEDQRDALTRVGDLYTYDPSTGRYVFQAPVASVTVTRKNPRGSRIGDRSTVGGLFLQDVSRNLMNSYLLPYRSQNIQANTDLFPYRQNLLTAQRQYLQPQIMMSNYEAKYQPYSFWIGQGSKVLNALPLPRFNFSRFDKNYRYTKNY